MAEARVTGQRRKPVRAELLLGHVIPHLGQRPGDAAEAPEPTKVTQAGQATPGARTASPQGPAAGRRRVPPDPPEVAGGARVAGGKHRPGRPPPLSTPHAPARTSPLGGASLGSAPEFTHVLPGSSLDGPGSPQPPLRASSREVVADGRELGALPPAERGLLWVTRIPAVHPPQTLGVGPAAVQLDSAWVREILSLWCRVSVCSQNKGSDPWF